MRLNFARNIPGILILTENRLFEKLKAGYFNMLTSDPNIKVRVCLLKSFHEIIA